MQQIHQEVSLSPIKRQTCLGALRDGTAEGFRQHVPGAVGLLVKGVSLCLIGMFAHFVLDMDFGSPAASAAAGGVGVGVVVLRSILTAFLSGDGRKHTQFPPGYGGET
jgi:hypothetical protein